MGNSNLKYKIEYATPYRPANPLDDNIDIHVKFETGEVYWGTLFTIANIQRLMREQNVKSFWATNMVIVDDLSEETIHKAIEEMMEFDHLLFAFDKILG